MHSGMSSSKTYKLVWAVLTLAFLILAGTTQHALNRQRLDMGVGRGESLGKSAPPVLVFTTVALGGFRGLIANLLWIRAIELQDEGKFFEKVQLADWITKLQPHFVSVWAFQAWDMAYNISVKFSQAAERWQWVLRAIELLRDEALRYNPDETLIYQQLSWLFQHKMGQDMDDAHFYYKQAWAKQMDAVLGTNYLELIRPETEEEKERARILTQKLKMDPEQMKQIDEEFGPLEWRLPEASAIYWATQGMRKAKPKDLMPLRREIYQNMQTSFRRGRLISIADGENRIFQFGPNLEIIPNVSRAYEKMMEEEPEMEEHIAKGYRNFLKDAVSYLYIHNRQADAQRWMDYLLEKYPDVSALDMTVESGGSQRQMADMTLDEYVVARATETAGETSNERVTQLVEGLLVTSYFNLAIGEDQRATGYALLAKRIWDRFMKKTGNQAERLRLPPFDRMKEAAIDQFGATYSEVLANRLRTKLGLPAKAEESVPAEPTPDSTSTPASTATADE